MPLQGLHVLLTYQCNLECDHCFVWGGPAQTGVMTGADLGHALRQARDMGTVEWIYYEGGEPFLYYSLLRKGVRDAARMGFRVGVVTNGYWATTVPDAVECLRAFRGKVQDLSISSDLYHRTEDVDRMASNAAAAAAKLGIPASILRVAQPEAVQAAPSFGQLPPGESAVMYRGRAARNLVARTGRRPWAELTRCPHENLRDPGRVHLDPLGNVHLCQGIVLGNLRRATLSELFAAYRPEEHPVVGPLIQGGPAALARRYGTPLVRGYADACHLCDAARRSLRGRFPEILGPDQMYGLGAA